MSYEDQVEEAKRHLAHLLANSPGKRKPKYEIGQRVKVSGWTKHDFGKIVAIDWIYHHRMYEYAWGYFCKYEGGGPGLTYTYVPEGYVKPVEDEEDAQD